MFSTVEIENFEQAKQQGLPYKTDQYQTRTLTSILDGCNCPKEIDILSVDVEEHDLNALKSLDFTKYTPKVVVVEDETFQPGSPQENLVHSRSLLTSKIV